jgi:hypothetical protein
MKILKSEVIYIFDTGNNQIGKIKSAKIFTDKGAIEIPDIYDISMAMQPDNSEMTLYFNHFNVILNEESNKIIIWLRPFNDEKREIGKDNFSCITIDISFSEAKTHFHIGDGFKLKNRLYRIEGIEPYNKEKYKHLFALLIDKEEAIHNVYNSAYTYNKEVAVEYSEDLSHPIRYITKPYQKVSRKVANCNYNDFWEFVLFSNTEDSTQTKIKQIEENLKIFKQVEKKLKISKEKDNSDSFKHEYETNLKKEKDNMKNSTFAKLMGNLTFGAVDDNRIKYSFKGIAFDTADGGYVVYNSDSTFTNIGDMVIDMPVYVMPVTKNQIKVGDIVQHNGMWVIVREITPTEIRAVIPSVKEIVSIVPETSIFGFNYFSKVMDIFGNVANTANSDNPFGDMLPLVLMGDSNNKDIMMLMAMNGGAFDMNNLMIMAMILDGDTKSKNLFETMIMMNMLKDNSNKGE